jgi:deoxyadenosine/deoxycytidine kinase
MEVARARLETLGILGVGKTTFLTSSLPLISTGHVTACLEDLSNIREEIEFWLADRSTRSYFMQTVFYAHAARILSCGRQKPMLVSDFSLLGHHFIYSRSLLQLGLLSQFEFAALGRLLALLDSLLPPVSGFILCEAPISLVADRAQRRARTTETTIEVTYLQLLQEALYEYVASTSLPVFRVDTAEFEPTKPALPQGLEEFLRKGVGEAYNTRLQRTV